MAEIITSTEEIQMAMDQRLAQLMAAGVIQPPVKQRQKRINWEKNIAYEWMIKYHMNDPYWIRVEVGPIPPGENQMLYARTRRWVDAVVRMPDHLLVIEFKMKAEPSVISQLEHYATLIPQTPLFSRWKDLPVKIKIVAALVDESTHAFIESKGIDVEIFTPTNYAQWYDQVVLKKGKAKTAA